MTSFKIIHKRRPSGYAKWYIGNDTGTLYLRTHDDRYIVAVGSLHMTGCEGMAYTSSEVLKGNGVTMVDLGSIVEITV